MSIPILEFCKKRKRRPKLYGFHTFCDPGCPVTFSGPFRDNIRVFLQQCAVLEEYSIEGMSIWCTLLINESKNFVVPLYTIEEDVKHSPHPFCDHCRCAGWNNNFLSKRKYHVMIPADDNWNRPLEEGVLDLQSHLLHGLVHCNGFGHLVCVNGNEGGSKFLCGREIMDLWDRICTNLQTRKVTVEDLSKKRSMDLRLLHGVAYGHPWFGRWGYKFCRGSFGVIESNYTRAIEVLSSIELDSIIQDFSNGNGCREIKRLIRYYRDLSETQLFTIRDLLRVMLTLKSRAPGQKKPVTASTIASSSPSLRPSTRISLKNKHIVKNKSVKCRKFASMVSNMDSRWPVRRLEYTAQVIVDALKDKKEDRFNHGGMTRQEVRDAARMHIGDTGLLDYVLKSMNNVMVGSYIVRRAVNPSTRILEYTIHDLSNGGVQKPEPEAVSESLSIPTLVPGADVYNDVVYLYRTVLLDYPKSELVELAIRAILDCKVFVKEWPLRDQEDPYLRFICRVMLSSKGLETERTREFPPGEIIMVPPHATVGELKVAVESALRDTYCVMEQFVVTEIQEMEGMNNEEVLFGVIESGSDIWVRGVGLELGTSDFKYEGGAQNWVVRCECGARDDDGERMVACDICEVWQHTVCIGIEDAEAVPPLFVCHGCSGSLHPPTSEYGLKFDCPGELLPPASEYGLEFEFGSPGELLPPTSEYGLEFGSPGELLPPTSEYGLEFGSPGELMPQPMGNYGPELLY